MRLDLFLILMYHSSTKISSVGVKHFMRDLLSEVDNYACPQTSDKRHIYDRTFVTIHSAEISRLAFLLDQRSLVTANAPSVFCHLQLQIDTIDQAA